MALIKYVLTIGLLAISSTTFATSFDCASAQTKVEKLICSNPDISTLDDRLNFIYDDAKTNIKDETRRARYISSEKDWLKNTRNKCADSTCLIDSYNARIATLDPFSDQNITCEKMEDNPKVVFSGADLGSGSMAPTTVDYDCKKSLHTFPYLKKIAELAETIRAQNQPQICTGTIVHAQWRGYAFELAEAGMAPGLFLDEQSKPDIVSDQKHQYEYFEKWSIESPYNFKLYKDFFVEYESGLPRLVQYYRENFGWSQEKSLSVSRVALNVFLGRAVGGFPRRMVQDLESRPEIVMLALNDQSTVPQLRTAIAKMPKAEDRDKQVYEAAKIALMHNRDKVFISTLLANIDHINDSALNDSGEPILFSALFNIENVKMLIKKGVAVNDENFFGKTPIFYAIGFNDHELVKLLLASGADINHKYKSASELNSDECGPASNIKHTLRTPLMHAAQNSDVEMLKLLVDKGAHINDIDEIGYSVLDYAVTGGSVENQKYLKSKSVKSGVPVFPSDSSGNEVPTNPLQESSSLPVSGYISTLEVSASHPDVLIGSVLPWDTLEAKPEHGIFTFSVKDPLKPKILGHVPSVYADLLRVSKDGNYAYVSVLKKSKKMPDKSAGLFVFDLSDPAKPSLKSSIEGDFMTMQLSGDGKYLFLQERNLAWNLHRGLLIYEVNNGNLHLMCENPLAKDGSKFVTFAYDLISYPYNQNLLVGEQNGKFKLFDISDPCHPIQVALTGTDKLSAGGKKVVYLNNIMFVAGGGTFESFKLTDSVDLVSAWEGNCTGININPRTSVLTAIFEKRIGLYRLTGEGQMTLAEKFEPGSPIGAAVTADNGWVYVGLLNELKSIKSSSISTVH